MNYIIFKAVVIYLGLKAEFFLSFSIMTSFFPLGSMEWSMGLYWGGGCPYWYSCILLGVQCKEHHPGINGFKRHHEPLDHYRLNFGGLSLAIHPSTWWKVSRILSLDVLWTWSGNSSLYIKFFIIQTVSVCIRPQLKSVAILVFSVWTVPSPPLFFF